MSLNFCVKVISAAIIVALSFNVAAADYELSPDGNAVIRIEKSKPISSSSFNASLITSDAAYKGWSVSKASGGSVSVDTYNAGWVTGSTSALGGGDITASYSQSTNVGSGKSLNWIQVITVDSDPIKGSAAVPFLDPSPNDDNLPFYLTAAEQPTRGSGTSTSVKFDDFSTRFSSSLSKASSVNWHAQLYPAEYDGAKDATVYNGFEWGWSMKPATIGSSSGVFDIPNPHCPPATCSGLGSNSISWGQGESGTLSFTGESFAPKVGDEFKVGTLSYHNGTTVIGSEINAIDLIISLNLTNIPELNPDSDYHTILTINNTPNTDDPKASADSVLATGFATSFHVLEGNSASADLMAELTPILKITPHPLIAPNSAADANKDLNTVPDPSNIIGYQLQLVGFANPTAGGFITVIPEPETYALMLAGLGLIGIMARRRKPA